MMADIPTTVSSQMLAEARTEVTQADQKASMLLAGLGIGFGIVLSGQLSGNWSPEHLNGFGERAWWVGAAFAVASVALAAFAIWPRFHAEDRNDGLAYWGHVASYDDFEQFKREFESKALSPSDRTLHQLWHLARLVQRKYTCIRWSLSLAGISVLIVGTATLIFR